MEDNSDNFVVDASILRAKHGWANVRYTNQIYDYLEILEDLD